MSTRERSRARSTRLLELKDLEGQAVERIICPNAEVAKKEDGSSNGKRYGRPGIKILREGEE